MPTQQPRRRIPEIQFRVLIIGRANAGKTSILKRVCETTNSPKIYRGNEEVELGPSMDRGEHEINDELVFSDHRGYVFHDSRGIEAGDITELEILRLFIQRKCGEKRLKERLHAIWYCVPMDNQRPQLDLKFYNDICPDRNVPVIVIFTKFDQFLRNVKMHLDDFPEERPPNSDVSEVAEDQFQEHYLRPLGNNVTFVRLQNLHKENTRCYELIKETTAALNDDAIASMLLAIQSGNLTLSVETALHRVNSDGGFNDKSIKLIVRECLSSFPYIWVRVDKVLICDTCLMMHDM